jgi:hypothetical protein
MWMGVFLRGGAVLEQGFLLRVELPGGGSISQEVRPEDKMATPPHSQNDDIITLSDAIKIGK